MKQPQNSLRDYCYMNAIDEGLAEWLKGFWEWLTGKYNKGVYDPENDAFDYDKKVKYLDKQDESSIKVYAIKDKQILEGIIDKSLVTDNSGKDRGFVQTNGMIKKDSSKAEVTKTNKWLGFIINTKELRETCGLVAYRLDDPEYKDSVVIYFTEFLEEYSFLSNEKIINDLKTELSNKGNTQVILIDNNLIKHRITGEDKIELTKIKGKKNAYIL